MINIFIAILALAIGLYIGFIICGHDKPVVQQEPDRNSPMVICMLFHKKLTKDALLEVLKPRAIQIARHFGLPSFPIDKELCDSMDPLADKMMKWWNPEYNELVLVAHRPTQNGSVVLNWTWSVPSHGAVDELGR